MAKRTIALWTLGILLTVSLCTVALAEWGPFGFDENPGKALKLKLPKVTFTAAEEEQLYAGKPVTRLLDSSEGLKIGYMRFFAPFDPITAWMVATDAEHLALEDPSYPKSGSITDKRRSFMPYVFDVATCVEKGKTRMYQLLVMPFVEPRRLCVDKFQDTKSFPYESSWTMASDQLCCQDKANPAMEKYYKDAVFLKKNQGAWNIGPLPKKFRKTPGDILRADCVYFVDTDPGGDLSKIQIIVNKATSTALPKVMGNVVFHGKNWESHLAKHHGAAAVAKYKALVEEYKQSMAEK